jgi:hypothetical protein
MRLPIIYFLGKPLFPGTSTINQIEKIVTTIDIPSQRDVKVSQPLNKLKGTVSTVSPGNGGRYER